MTPKGITEKFAHELEASMVRNKEIASRGGKDWKHLKMHSKSDNLKNFFYLTYTVSLGVTFAAVWITENKVGIWGCAVLAVSSIGIYFRVLRYPKRGLEAVVKPSKPTAPTSHAETPHGTSYPSGSQSVKLVMPVYKPLLDKTDPLFSESSDTVLNLSDFPLGISAGVVWEEEMMKILKDDIKGKKKTPIEVTEFFAQFSPKKCFQRSVENFHDLLLDSENTEKYRQLIRRHTANYENLASDVDLIAYTNTLTLEFSTFSLHKESSEKLFSESEIINMMNEADKATDINLGSLTSAKIIGFLVNNPNLRRLCLKIENDTEEFPFIILPPHLTELFMEVTASRQKPLKAAQIKLLSNSKLEKIGLERFSIDSEFKEHLKKYFKVSKENDNIYIRKDSEQKGNRN